MGLSQRQRIDEMGWILLVGKKHPPVLFVVRDEREAQRRRGLWGMNAEAQRCRGLWGMNAETQRRRDAEVQRILRAKIKPSAGSDLGSNK